MRWAWMKEKKRLAYLGLGSNLGEREHYLREAIIRLIQPPQNRLEAVSSLYETAPVGYVDQPHFLNMVIAMRTSLSPQDLLREALAIEQQLERVREVRWGPRTIDIDLLLYGEQKIVTEELSIPHPRMHERAFVLLPLVEIAPHVPIVGSGKTASQWMADTVDGKANEVKKIARTLPLIPGGKQNEDHHTPV
ncbi:2-amino-4-hydroxy-6-hydroxymethyldihydropteridine diphosphokinase [Mechercharimyces sp. CAU 1602]|uniref:2-amino-4-hydroxy-6- hydroxymethyldihydropteridine diphosphokinase n=1 Tax=Mechercharimyces sp. CAU 1602 TaxID=2973933 RepID=UPI0021627CBE|nr:2-amino-4-hydroxy-6-hydroxymethyldihydropteridine diphosphokinase [Mechercharimyces sp. CAU 1602]MCS1352404.1 2-amino-4-hydroxy-6-hydroxymethyldihydropteridine diphosphokinase [Mechercharimyces sp. CAU 1602]